MVGQQYWGNVPGDSLCYGTEQSPVDIVQTTFNPSLYGPSLYGSNGGCQVSGQFVGFAPSVSRNHFHFSFTLAVNLALTPHVSLPFSIVGTVCT